MIFGSLLLILVAIVLAVLGVVQGSDPLLVGSIVASLLTAVFLAVSARQAAALRLAAGTDGPAVPFTTPADDDETLVEEPVGTGLDTESDEAAEDAAVATVEEPSPGDGVVAPEERQRASALVAIPSQYSPVDRDEERLGPGIADRPAPDSPTQVEFDLRPGPVRVEMPTDGSDLDDEPLDEPPAQLVPIADAALVAGLDAIVTVVDGRPRYHLADCAHLVGKEAEALPVNEAVALGFTPCSLCEPDTTLLAQARRA